jgi:hypothetical protein
VPTQAAGRRFSIDNLESWWLHCHGTSAGGAVIVGGAARPDEGVRDLYEALSINPKSAYLHYVTAYAEAKLEEKR